MIKFDLDTYTTTFITDKNNHKYLVTEKEVDDFLKNHSLAGWYNIDNLFSNDVISQINKVCDNIKKDCEVLLIIGIGGSYIGSLALYEMLKNQAGNDVAIYFLGHTLSGRYFEEILDKIKDKEVITYVVSKSGNTLEVVESYKLILNYMKQRYSLRYREKIVIATNSKNGFLRDEIMLHNYKSFIIPDDIGGRYSVFTAVSLFVLALLGFDFNSLKQGILQANEDIARAIKLARYRQILYEAGKLVDLITVDSPYLNAFTLWYQQLYSESLGKEKSGILPVSFILPRDLHSLEQFIQQGNPIIFQTVIETEEKSDNNNFRKINTIQKVIFESMINSHLNIPIFKLSVGNINLEKVGYLMQFCLLSCAISGYIIKINPFDQPGVEFYKKDVKNKLKR